MSNSQAFKKHRWAILRFLGLVSLAHGAYFVMNGTICCPTFQEFAFVTLWVLSGFAAGIAGERLIRDTARES